MATTDPNKTETESGDTSGAVDEKPDEKPADQPADKGSKLELSAEQQAAVNALIAKEKRAAVEAAKKQLAAIAEEEKLKANGETEKLLVREKEKTTELTARVAELELTILKSTIAAKHKLTPEAVKRLRGSNEEELEADAKELKKLLGNTAPNGDPVGTPAGGNNNSGAAGKGNDKEKVQEYKHTFSM